MKSFYYSLLFVLLSFSIGCGNSSKNDAAPFTVRVGSYNIHNAVGMDNRLDFDRVAQVIDDMDIDAIAIQELDSATERSNGLVVLDELAKRTNMVGTFNASIEYRGGKYGNGILTKEQPLNKEAIALPGSEEKRSLLIAEMEDYVLCCTHLSLNEADRQESMLFIQRHTQKYKSKPVLLAGDLNALPSSDEIKYLSNHWIMLSDSTQGTYPSDAPDRVIDYIFLKNNDKFTSSVKDRKVVNEPVASDHRPLWVEVSIK
ncbi:MAG: metallophosphoesterase [Bacteroidales bacterium]|nr:metallophosphoesterase [Bacteroidales bacterium]